MTLGRILLGLAFAGVVGLPALVAPVAAHMPECSNVSCYATCESAHVMGTGGDPPHGCGYVGCPPQPVHRYLWGSDASVEPGGFGVGAVTVADTSVEWCGEGPGTWDGDPETGIGGGFFGHGPWARDPACGYALNVHGGNLVVHDAVYGDGVLFRVGANDMDGPVIVTDPATGETTCTTDGTIAPEADADDCMSVEYRGEGATCGAGGDGGYWVFLVGVRARMDDPAQSYLGPTTGTITAYG